MKNKDILGLIEQVKKGEISLDDIEEKVTPGKRGRTRASVFQPVDEKLEVRLRKVVAERPEGCYRVTESAIEFAELFNDSNGTLNFYYKNLKKEEKKEES